jgi:tetratricopeptide (TPR) repeat protein
MSARVAAAMALCALGGCAPLKTAEKPNATPLEKSFSDHPDDRAINIQLGQQSEATGDWLRAEQYYVRAEALGEPQEKIVPPILRVLVKAQRYGEALERCQRRLSTVPEDRATRFVKAALYAALDRPKDAEKELSALVRARPDDPQAYLALGRLYRDGYNDPARARQMFEKYLALAPNGADAAAVRYELAEPAPAEPAPVSGDAQ